VWALLGDGQLSMLPRGVDEYLERRAATATTPVDTGSSGSGGSSGTSAKAAPAPGKAKSGSAEERNARKAVARLDKQLKRLLAREEELNAAVLAAGTDYARIATISAELQTVIAEKDAVELEWLDAAEVLER
jgi:ATP-binding cassette subfamily F protein uup